MVRFIDDTASRRYSWYPGDGEQWLRGLAAILLGGFAFALFLLFTRDVMVAAVVGTSATAGMAGLNFGRRDARELVRFDEVRARPRRRHTVLHTGRAVWRGLVEGTGGAVAAVVIVNLPDKGVVADWIAPLVPAVVGALAHQVGMMHERVTPKLPPERPSKLPKRLLVPYRGKTPGEFAIAMRADAAAAAARAAAAAAASGGAPAPARAEGTATDDSTATDGSAATKDGTATDGSAATKDGTATGDSAATRGRTPARGSPAGLAPPVDPWTDGGAVRRRGRHAAPESPDMPAAPESPDMPDAPEPADPRDAAEPLDTPTRDVTADVGTRDATAGPGTGDATAGSAIRDVTAESGAPDGTAGGGEHHVPAGADARRAPVGTGARSGSLSAGPRHAARTPATAGRRGPRRAVVRRAVAVPTTPAPQETAGTAAEPPPRPAPHVIRTGERHVGRARVPS